MTDEKKKIYLVLREVLEEELMSETEVELYVAKILNQEGPEIEPDEEDLELIPAA